MLVKEAKAIARRWVLTETGAIPGFSGAFYHGSTGWLADEAELPTGSDLDIMVTLSDQNPPVKPGKLSYHGVLLEISYLSQAELQSPERVLGLSHLAGSFRTASIIADPTGQLTALQARVARDYAKRRWVYARCEQVQGKLRDGLRLLAEVQQLPDQVIVWLFSTSLTTHIPLVAGLKNPTVRKRYLAVRELLADYGELALYEALLAHLGCDGWSRAQVERHLTMMTAVFDVAKTVVQSPFPFASDLTEQARPIAIDGSWTLIERGDHREAVFWIVVTYSRCLQVFAQDAPEALTEPFREGFRRLLADLGIASHADLLRRAAAVEAFLPQVWAVAEAIMAANTEIEE
ncbi:MAG TPA: hypothetical protein VIL85_23445 [Thermomicrobiales bacterium]|jgi:hypothetical protein